MADVTQAAADARAFLKSFRALTEFAESVSKLSSIQDEANTLERKKETLNTDIGKLTNRVKELQAQQHKLDTDISGKEGVVASTLAAAKSEAAQIKANAEATARDIIAGAEAKRKEADRSTKELLDRRHKELAIVNEKIIAAEKQHNQLQSAISDLKRKFVEA